MLFLCPPKEENEVKVENNGGLKIQNFNCNSKICTWVYLLSRMIAIVRMPLENPT